MSIIHLSIYHLSNIYLLSRKLSIIYLPISMLSSSIIYHLLPSSLYRYIDTHTYIICVCICLVVYTSLSIQYWASGEAYLLLCHSFKPWSVRPKASLGRKPFCSSRNIEERDKYRVENFWQPRMIRLAIRSPRAL